MSFSSYLSIITSVTEWLLEQWNILFCMILISCIKKWEFSDNNKWDIPNEWVVKSKKKNDEKVMECT